MDLFEFDINIPGVSEYRGLDPGSLAGSSFFRSKINDARALVQAWTSTLFSFSDSELEQASWALRAFLVLNSDW